MPTTKTAAPLQQAAQALTFESETDAPWEAFAWPAARGTPTGAEVRRRGGHSADAPVEEQAVEDFFAPLCREQDWFGDEERAVAAKYRALLDVVKRCLKSPKVIRVGERQVTVYVVGAASEGGWAGLKTTAVET